MKISLALAAAAALLLSLVPAGAGTLYPVLPCRVFLDTSYTQIPGQCGMTWHSYPRRLFVRRVRQSSYYCGPYY